MSTTHALFYRVDHRNVVVESWCKPVTIPRGRGTDIGGILRRASDDISAEDGLAFAGVLTGRSRHQLSVSDIYDLVCNSADGAVSNHYCRYARVPSEGGRQRGARKRSSAYGRLASIGAKAWYDDPNKVPQKLKDKFAEFTLVYLDRRDRSIEVKPVFLFKDVESSIVDLVAAHEWWEPITLFDGAMSLEGVGLGFRSDHQPSDPSFFPSEGGHLPPAAFDDDLDKDESGAITEDAETNESAIAPKKLKSVADVLCEGLLEETIVRFMEGDHNHPDNSLQAFRDGYLAKRPLILLETVHWELGPNIAKFMAEVGDLSFRAEGRYADYGSYQEGGIGGRTRGSVVLFSRRSFEGGGQDLAKEIDNRIRALLAAGDVGLVVTDNIMSLPAQLRLNRDFELVMPELVGPVRDRVFTEVFGPGAVPGPEGDLWTRYASALDLEKVYHAGARGVSAVQDLSERVQGRLTRMGATKGPALNEIHGLGEAKEHANAFIGDITAYLAGTIPWSQVDRGMLLVGPPGTGKTMMARAMSREAGIRFIHASASDWQSANHLGEHVQAIRGSFAMARRYAPSIIFIDEFDSIGRRGFGGHNEFYHTAVVNAVLEELQGFEDREGVIVMAATNRLQGVDPALRRAGRLDRVVQVNYPNIQALAKIYEYYVDQQRQMGVDHSDIDFSDLARMTFGQTGADVELYVRGAARRARGRTQAGDRVTVGHDDFVQEIMGSPLGESGAVRLSKEDMRRTAIHESGHALVQLTGPTKGANIAFVSVTPRADGTLGFVFTAPDERHVVTKDELFEDLRLLLGGRAAEEVIFGADNVSSGAGGPSPSSDLAQATRLLTAMLTQYGFSKKRGLLWSDVDESKSEVQQEVRETLETIYRETVRRISKNKRLLNRMVTILLDKQEITGDELRAMLGRR